MPWPDIKIQVDTGAPWSGMKIEVDKAALWLDIRDRNGYGCAAIKHEGCVVDYLLSSFLEDQFDRRFFPNNVTI